jgi:AcrR family transcriptional regulator
VAQSTTTPGAAVSHDPRHRGELRESEILDAACQVLCELGYDRLTTEAVAARAKASKATLYRRWANKAELVVEAVAARKCPPPTPDTGSLRGDLLTMCSAALPSDVDARLASGLMTAIGRHPELAAMFKDTLKDPILSTFDEVFTRARARGEIAPERDLEMLGLTAFSLVFTEMLMTNRPVDQEFITRVMTAVVLPLATAGAPVPTSSDLPPEPCPPVNQLPIGSATGT